MTRTDLLSLAERLETIYDQERICACVEAADILRKLAELRPVATSYTMEALVPGGTVKTHVMPLHSLPAGTKLYQLSEVLTDE